MLSSVTSQRLAHRHDLNKIICLLLISGIQEKTLGNGLNSVKFRAVRGRTHVLYRLARLFARLPQGYA